MEAVSGEESMVFRLITPKFLCPILVEHEVGKKICGMRRLYRSRGRARRHAWRRTEILSAIVLYKNAGLVSLEGKKSLATRGVNVRSGGLYGAEKGVQDLEPVKEITFETAQRT